MSYRRASGSLQPMFDERHFPYECEEQSVSATVTHGDIQGVLSYLATPPVAEAVEQVSR